MNKWTKFTAEKFISEHIVLGKVIVFDGNFTLRQCSAADFLINHCGYLSR